MLVCLKLPGVHAGLCGHQGQAGNGQVAILKPSRDFGLAAKAPGFQVAVGLHGLSGCNSV